jgi:hypothetical protein
LITFLSGSLPHLRLNPEPKSRPDEIWFAAEAVRMSENAFLLLLLLAFAAVTATAHAKQPDVLSGLTSCPTDGPHRGCAPVVLPFERRSDLRNDEDARTTTVIYRLRGRLNGEPLNAFTLQISKTDDGSYFYPIAYVGRSAKNRPILLTDKGTLEIRDPFVDISEDANVIIVDESSEKVLARYFEAGSAAIEMTDAGQIQARNDNGKWCVEAPQRRPGLLDSRPGPCHQMSDLQPANISVKRLLALLPELNGLGLFAIPDSVGDFGGGGWKVLAFRVPKKHLLVVTLSCVDACGYD